MPTARSSEAAPGPSPASGKRLPLRRYALTVPLATAVFIGLAMLQERQVFLPLFGLGAEGGPPSTAESPEAGEAEACVQAYTAALAEAYRLGSTAPVAEAKLATSGLLEELNAELEFTRQLPAEAQPSPSAFELVHAVPTGDGSWSVLTEETWAAPGAEASRLRFTYALRREGGRLQVTSATPSLPTDEAREAAH